jgi:hypothetical protein
MISALDVSAAVEVVMERPNPGCKTNITKKQHGFSLCSFRVGFEKYSRITSLAFPVAYKARATPL